MNRYYPKSRLATVERKKTLRTIAWSVLFVLMLSAALFYFGVPLLIKMAVFISEMKSPPSGVQQRTKTSLQAPELNALPEATPSASISVSGFAPPKTSVTVKVNNEDQSTTLAKDDGSFEIRITLAAGDNEIVATAKNDSGDESPASKNWTVFRDETPPELSVTNPIDGAKFSGDANKSIQIQGKTEIDATVTMNNRHVSVSSDGTFNSQTQLAEGDNHFDIVATDKAGNRTLSRITVSWHQQ